MRKDSPLLQYYYKHLPKAAEGQQTTGCPQGYYYNAMFKTCLPINELTTLPAKEQAQLKASNKPIPKDKNYGKKVDPYETIIAKETAAKQSERNQDLAKRAGISAAAAAAIVSGGAALPYLAPALEAPLLGTLGAEYGTGALTGSNLLNSYFAYQGAKNVPNVYNAWKDVANKPTWGNVGNAAAETAVTGLDMLPFTMSAAKGIPSVMQDVIQVGSLPKVGLRKSVDLVSPVGKELRAVEKYGKLNNLTEAEIKNMQMQKVGITSKQREGYFPGVSEIFSEYLTPYGYDNMGKRLLDIPRRIIKGETNTKKLVDNLSDVVMDQGQTLLSKPRYDAWRMYSGLPQEYGTFRLAETSPLNHSSYPKGSLNNTEIFSLNDEKRLLNNVPNKNDLSRYYYNNEDLVDDLDYLKNAQSELGQLNNSTKIYASDFGTTNVMGGHNRRFFDNKMEYNDIWDLNPGNLKVDKYFGKPFMSHGQVPYNINDIQLTLGDLIKKGERLKEYPNIKINPYKDRLLTDKFNNISNSIPNYSTVIKKQKEGGLLSRTVTCSNCGHSWKGVDGGMDPTTCHKCGGAIKMANGGDISIPALTTKMPALSLGGSIQMQPKESPLLNYYLQRTKGKRMIR